jgi:ATP-binding cassette subfamily B protein
MKMKDLVKLATQNNPKKVRPMLFWTMVEYFFRGAPYGIILFIIWELFAIIQNPAAQLNFPLLIIMAVSLLLVALLLFWSSKKAYLEMYFKTYDFTAEGRLKMANHIRKLSMGFYRSKDPGDIGSYLINDFGNVEFIFTHFFAQIYGSFLGPAVMLIYLAVVHWPLALIGVLVLPLAWPLTKFSVWLIRKLGRPQRKAKVDAQSRMLEYIYGMKLVKSYGLVGTRFERLKSSFDNLKRKSIKLEGTAGPIIVLANFMVTLGFVLMIIFGAQFFIGGQLTLLHYITFLVLGYHIYEPILSALTFVAEMNYFTMGVERLKDLYATDELVGSDPEAEPEGFDIELKNVSFRYHDTYVLEEVSAKIEEKSLVALVGPSGSGKTTMTRLIARFWDVDEGEIMLGYKNIKTYDPDVLLSKISIVFQEVYLFNDTILENIKIGNKNASREDIIEAAKLAQIHEFVEKLPEGYDTIVGEGGTTLSGGEKQRISIARAVLKDTPIILLDEATASLDPENEYYIQQAIDEIVKDKTVVIIAHRLNTVVNADQILVIDEGKIVERGNHDNLMRKGGLYKSMWDEQLKFRSWKFRSSVKV